MAKCIIKYAYEIDEQIVRVSVGFAIGDTLTATILQNSLGESTDSMESRRALAKHRYEWALSIAASYVLTSYNPYSPHLVEASAWIQFFGPDDSWWIPWKCESGPYQISPDHVHPYLYKAIENVLHTDRKFYMRGKCHYCVSFILPYSQSCKY